MELRIKGLFDPPKEMTREQKEQRAQEISGLLKKGGLYSGFIEELEKVLELFQDWRRSGHTMWPYPGSRLDQPYWVLHDFKALELREEWHKLRKELVIKSTAQPFRVG